MLKLYKGYFGSIFSRYGTLNTSFHAQDWTSKTRINAKGITKILTRLLIPNWMFGAWTNVSIIIYRSKPNKWSRISLVPLQNYVSNSTPQKWLVRYFFSLVKVTQAISLVDVQLSTHLFMLCTRHIKSGIMQGGTRRISIIPLGTNIVDLSFKFSCFGIQERGLL